MRARLGFAPLALAVMLVAHAASAEPLGRHFSVTPHAGWTIFDSDQKFPKFYPLRDDLYAGGRVGYQHNQWLGIEIAGGFTPTAEDGSGKLKATPAPAKPSASQRDTLGGRDIDFWHVSGDLVLTPWSSRYGGPFVFSGFSRSRFDLSSGAGAAPSKLEMGNLEFGGGVRLWLTDAIGIRLEARNIMWIPGDSNLQKRQHLVLGGGLTFAVGATPRDTDADGVPDRKDKCPATPRGARVDENGCPIDSDGDKVFDGLDACPDTPKGCIVDAKGCPNDGDGDAVCDGLDRCPDTPRGAVVDVTGCGIDSDGDGVLDGLDKCPDTPKGCTVDAAGCPADSDGDGVCDGLDKCADTPAGARVDVDGCPIEIIERETELLDTGMIRLQDVNFETGKANLLPESFPTLDVVGQVLGKWPELKIEVGGHTDSRGSNAYNQKLSQARADSVLAYMTRNFPGLKPEQFTVKGYGESAPIAPNTGELNMAKNRRVEFVVTNKEVLKRESERRRLLQKAESAPPAPTPAPADTTKK